MNLVFVCDLDTYSKNLDTDLTLSDCLFGPMNLTKHIDPDKYRYSGYGVEFDASLDFSINREFG